MAPFQTTRYGTVIGQMWKNGDVVPFHDGIVSPFFHVK
jgi:hypothetical protein